MQHTIIVPNSHREPVATVEAAEPAPGLRVYRAPDWVQPYSPFRWSVGHHEGACIAVARTEAVATAVAEAIADMTDWTGDMTTVYTALADRQNDMWARIWAAGGEHPQGASWSC